MTISIRQQKIIDFISENDSVKRLDIEYFIASQYDNISKITILRDLNFLIKENYIIKQGIAKNTFYSLPNNILRKYDVEKYFSIETDERNIKYPNFNFDIFSKLHNIFSNKELTELNKINENFRKQINLKSPYLIKKDFERLLIELSWKSSQIEGNTYSLLDTEILIKENIEAQGHKKEEAIMILNHKKALDFILQNKDYFQILSIKKIEELHHILVNNLGISKGFRKYPVGILGTNYKPLDNQHQIHDAIEKLIEIINLNNNILEKALITVLMISYIQPFEDGNKRTGRILANALLFAYNYCPLSYRSVKEVEYKKAVILFYENNSLEYFKRIFTEQFKFAVEKYF